MGMFTTNNGHQAMVSKTYDRYSQSGKKYSSIECFIPVEDMKAVIEKAEKEGHDVLKFRQTPYNKQDNERIFTEVTHFKGKTQQQSGTSSK